MKHASPILLLTVFILFIFSCVGTKKSQNNNQTKAESEHTQYTNPDPAHNARLSLDYYGTYEGTLPCADCEGIQTTIHLKEKNRFVLTKKYLGKADSAKLTKEGEFEWDKTGFIIKLKSLDLPNQYFVAENMLFQLDKEANRIWGDLAEKYILRKLMD